MTNKLLVVGYYDEVVHTDEMGPYDPDWQISNVTEWVNRNPEVSEDDPDYEAENRTRKIALAEQWKIYHSKLKAESIWSESRKRVFTVINTQTPDHQDEIDYIVDHCNNVAININGKQEHITSVAVFDVNEGTTFYISIYESVDFLIKVRNCQIDFALSLGIKLKNYVYYDRLDEPQPKLFNINLGTDTLFEDDELSYVYSGDNYKPIYFSVDAHAYVQNTNFGPTVTNYNINDDNNDIKESNTVNRYPRNSNLLYKYEMSNYTFKHSTDDSNSLSLSLNNSLLETTGINLLDTNYHWGNRPLGDKILLSSIFNLINLLILDSFQYRRNERYYLTPNMKRYLLSNFEFENDMNSYYRHITGIIGARGPVIDEIKGILRQHDEVSFNVLRRIVLTSRVRGNNFSVMSNDIGDTLNAHEKQVTIALSNSNITNQYERYVTYDKLLIVQARKHMESLFRNLIPVSI